MVIMLILCIVNAGISACFWAYEYHKGRKVMRLVRPAQNWKDGPRYMRDYVVALFGFKDLALDMTATILLSSVFSLGGVIGTSMGLMMSNVFSVYINFSPKKKGVANA